ncbi:glycosyltransferase family 2 protein [Zestomonas thermotolerans]|uniref:glycosyltransferase family 2 protein n=1 Tax=Zestomonas thermotolerans TaxID=157784 RepID=UPI0023EF7A8C|nr:glycosyltransferase family 2 protein [Pseudomonas thermotolerans]
MAEFVFWLCLFLPLFVYLGYPALLAVCALFRRDDAPTAPTELPRVSIIVAAYNEERNIEAKLCSLLESDYPRERRQIIVASDGSSDATVALARQFARAQGQDEDLQVLDLPRGGKASALNAAVAVADGEILVFSDADILWGRDTLRELVMPFNDPRVGAVGGYVTVASTGKSLAIGDKLYRRYEAWQRRLESRCGCLASADGALQALRRELFQPIPAGVTDDFFLATCASVAGRRIAFAERARASDKGVESSVSQFQRRRRITAQGLHSLVCRRELLNPLRHGLFAIGLFTHKLLRRLVPLLLVPLLLSNLWLWDAGPFYRLCLIAQLGGYALALAGLVGQRRQLPKLLRLAAYVLISLSGIAAGIWHFVSGQRYHNWNPQQNR